MGAREVTLLSYMAESPKHKALSPNPAGKVGQQKEHRAGTCTSLKAEHQKAIFQTNALFPSFRRCHRQPLSTPEAAQPICTGPPARSCSACSTPVPGPSSPSAGRRELWHLRSISGVYTWLPRSATSMKWGENYNNITNEIE